MKPILKTLTLCLAIVLAGCSSVDSNSSNSTATPAETTTAVAETTAAETTAQNAAASGGINPLTGESGFPADAQNKRPVSFMVNNVKIAIPEAGIDDADLCYEVPVEAGITRILTMYANTADVVRVGSVRSARHYFLDLAAPFDTIYIHFGGSIYAYDTIKSRNLDSIDGTKHANAFEQDKKRLAEKGQEHSFFATQSSLQKLLASTKERTQGKTPLAFDFGKEGENVATGEAAKHIVVPFSSYTEAFFDYSAADREYKKGQYGAVQIDTNSGKQVGTKNVFVLFTDIQLIPGQEKGLVNVGLEGGSGYYASEGVIKPIKWKKGDYKSLLTYTNADGSALKVNVGSSWVCIVGTDREKLFSYQ